MNRVFRTSFHVKDVKWFKPRAYSTGAVKTCDPLRILFFGSDAFSAHSLHALVAIKERHTADNELVKSIDVVCRTDKRIGRDRSVIAQVPIKPITQELELPLHQLDSFENSDLSGIYDSEFNLIVAVSFGLLIPATLIRRAKYGGLNVHPSFLPDLRGAAPLQQTILLGRQQTGVTIQTLHPTLFDHGIVLSRTPFPGITVPPTATVPQLSEVLAEEGARLLTGVITSRKHVEPIEPLAPFSHEDFLYLTGGRGLSKARKVKKEDARVDWDKDTTDAVLRKIRVFGRVWDETGAGALPKTKSGTRIFYDKAQELNAEDAETLYKLWQTGSVNEPAVGKAFLFSINVPKSQFRAGVKMTDGCVLEILSCTATGRPHEQKVRPGAYGIGLISGWIQNAEHNSKE